MEESFELLSSMSPKVVMKKPIKKGTSVLALKRNIRRSLVFSETERTDHNNPPNIVEILSSSESVTDSEESLNVGPQRINAKTIIIEESDNDDDLSEEKPPENYVRELPKPTLPSRKIDDILHWIDNLDLQGIDKTAFSEVSTIVGDNVYSNFQPKERGNAVNSTLVDSNGKRFDELFVNKRKPKTDLSSCVDDETYHSAKNVIVDDSFEAKFSIGDRRSEKVSNGVIEDSFVEKNRQTPELDKSEHSNDKNMSEYNEQIDRISSSRNQEEKSKECKTSHNNSNNTKPSSKSNGLLKDLLKQNSVKEDSSVDSDVESMLDSLYGDKWRKKQHLVLPNSEPRKNNPLRENNMPNTERRPKPSLVYKNPYLDTEFRSPTSFLLKTQTPRSTKKETPCLARLRALCDPDTDPEESTDKCRQKLDFSDDNCNDKESQEDKTSKYFTNKSSSGSDSSLRIKSSNKENINMSKLSESLEDRIKKKINNVKDRSTKKKKPVQVENKKKPAQDKEKTAGRKKTAVTKKTATENYRTPKISTSSVSSDESDTDRKKTVKPKSKKKLSNDSISISSDDEKFDQEIKKIHRSSLANGTYSFLESLSGSVPLLRCDMAARIFRNNFSAHKDELYRRLFNLYNEKIFENSIPADSGLEWNDRMRGTAGFCYCKKITRRNGDVERSVRIVLSTKVIDSADRLRDTLVHEMCHAATWIVNSTSDGHGPYWRAWAYKAMRTFPELPPIKRCHDYVINTKYTYRCTQCGYSVGRHSKSLDITRKRCGHCYGTFEVLVNKVSKKGEVKSVPSTPKQATGFALFVKENYGIYKNPDRNHGTVMKLLGQKFQELKMKN